MKIIELDGKKIELSNCILQVSIRDISYKDWIGVDIGVPFLYDVYFNGHYPRDAKVSDLVKNLKYELENGESIYKNEIRELIEYLKG